MTPVDSDDLRARSLALVDSWIQEASTDSRREAKAFAISQAFPVIRALKTLGVVSASEHDQRYAALTAAVEEAVLQQAKHHSTRATDSQQAEIELFFKLQVARVAALQGKVDKQVAASELRFAHLLLDLLERLELLARETRTLFERNLNDAYHA